MRHVLPVSSVLRLPLAAGVLVAAAGSLVLAAPSAPSAHASPSGAPSATPATFAGAAVFEGVPEHLQPKSATGVDRFLAEHPEHDGRGTVVAIFDTGVDPGAPGLQVTSDGRPKIVDVVDGSGSGDVDTSTVVEASEDGTLEGRSGRTLVLDPDWSNPTGAWRVGLKPAAELWPGGLVGRMRGERSKDRAEAARVILDDLRRRHAKAEAAKDEDAAEDLEQLIEQAEALAERRDAGPVHDCVVFHDGEHWRAVVDTDEDGDLRDEAAMTNYRTFREWSTFGDEDLLNFAVNVYEEGDVLSIVTDCGGHGTHVAGIVAAHFPGQEHLDGMAPGAQIVSVKIGDHRLRSSSTGTGEMRGVVAVLENDVDLVNMSYGGPTAFPNAGLQVDMLSELVNRHGVLFLASAGNDGPALTTVGSPGGTTSALIGVGAAIGPEMMVEQYAVRRPHDELAYTWSSRGPTTDGALGVDISAPGGAIAPVPNWTLQRSMLMNGTSMSSPSACGGLALLVSGLKAEDRAVDPHAIKRAIQRTARPLPTTSVFGQGPGMLQVDAAWQWLTEHRDAIDDGVRYEVSVDGGRGILLREPQETDGPHVTRVTIDPVFHEDEDNRRRVDFAMDLVLEPTAPWIEVAPTLHLVHGGRGFEVRVEPSDLEPGVHFATIDAFDAADPERGPVVRVPVTVIRPERLRERLGTHADPRLRGEVAYVPGHVHRTFVAVPEGATWADLELRRTDDADEARRYWIQTVQLLEDRAYVDHHLDTRASIPAGDRWQGSIPVVAGGTMEVCVAQFWSSLGESELEMTLTFRGLAPSATPVALDGAQTLHPIDVHARLGDHPVSPSGSFTTVRRTLVPAGATVSAMSPDRDVLPDHRQAHQLVATYRLHLADDARVAARPVTSRIPAVDDAFFSHIVHYVDANGRWLLARSAWDDDPVSLDAGDYELHYHLVHFDRDALEAAGKLPLQLDLRMSSPVRVGVHGAPEGPGRRGGGFGTRTVRAGESARVYLSLPALDDWPKLAEPGDLLVGTIGFGDADGIPGGRGRRPEGWPLMATVPARTADAAPSRTSAQGATADADDPEAALADAVRDARIAQLDVRSGDALDALEGELLEAQPDHRPLLRAILERRAALAAADADDDDADPVASWTEVLDAADALADAIDRTALAAAKAIPPDEDDEDAIDVERTQADLVLALHHRASALLHLAQEARAEAGSDDLEAVDEAIEDLGRWADLDDARYHDLRLGAARAQERHGAALALAAAAVDRDPLDRAVHEARLELVRQLGWDAWAAELERDLAVRFADVDVRY